MFEPDPTPVPQAEIESALKRLDEAEAIETTSKVIDLMAALKESLSPGAPEQAAEVIEDAAGPQQLVSPRDMKGWTAARKDGIETFTAPDGFVYVRARTGEDADVIVSFTRTPGLGPMRLVLADESISVKSAARKRRRDERELRNRGYDV